MGPIAESDEFSTLVWRANLTSNFAGELFVRDIELKRPAGVALAFDPPEDGSFINLPFEDAIQQFATRDVMSPEAFQELTDVERFRAFTMARAASQRLIDIAHIRLNAAMQPDGPGLREFVRGVQQDAVDLGFTPNSHAYLENVFRTGVATSYNAGRYRAQTDPDVVAATGFWQYRTAGDNRVRPQHQKLDGKVWRIGDPEAKDVYPPNGFMCRCNIVVLDEEDVEQEQLNRKVDLSDVATPGFSGAPDTEIRQQAGTTS